MGLELLGRKLGMTQIFLEDGDCVPVTVIGVGPCVVVQKKGEVKKDNKEEVKKGDAKTDAKTEAKKDAPKTKFEIRIPTNSELAANLKGHILLVHGDMDNNVHPANTIRLVDALIKANKRFDMLILPGKPHAFGDYQPYFTQRMWEYFAEYLLNDKQMSADMNIRTPSRR